MMCSESMKIMLFMGFAVGVGGRAQKFCFRIGSFDRKAFLTITQFPQPQMPWFW